MKVEYISLFSGVGGFEKGIERAFEKYNGNNCSQFTTKNRRSDERRHGASEPDRQYAVLSGHGEHASYPICIGYSEIDQRAIEIYRYHYPNHKNYGSATDIICGELPDFDLLVGGFPCQAFSIAGKRQGFEDTRGTLFFEIARILEAKKPRNFLLENVKGLFSHDGGKTFKTIIRTLTAIGYCVEWSCLNSKDFGVPQNRERVFIVGHFGRIPEREIFPLGSSGGEIVSPESKRIVSGTISTKNQSGQCQFDGVQIGTLRTHNDGKGFRKMQDGNCPTIPARAREDGSGQPVIMQLNPSKESGGKQPYQQNRVYDSEGIVPTHQAEMSGGSYAIQAKQRIRRLTPLECERLQGFDDFHTKYGINDKGETIEMSDTSRYKALGNAVTVNVIEAIISKIIEVGRFDK